MKNKPTMTRGEMYEVLRKANLDDSLKNTYEKTRFIMDLMDKVHNLPARYEDGERKEQKVSLDKDLISQQDVLQMLEKENTSARKAPIVKKITELMQNNPSKQRQNRSISTSEFPSFMQENHTENSQNVDSPSL